MRLGIVFELAISNYSMMKYKIIFLLFSLFALQVYAQPDKNEKKSIKIPAKETEKKDTTSVKLDIKPNSKIGITPYFGV